MFIKTFKQLSKNNVNIAGGKGASLGEMVRSGMPVPPGFVILVEAFDRFLEETDLVQEIAAHLAKINYQDLNSVDRASNEIRDLFNDAIMPKDLAKEFLSEFKRLKSMYVAVRSSATAEDSAVASWAGELETFLNTTKETLLANIKRCWSSLFTPRALFYAFEKGLVIVDHQVKIRAKSCLPASSLSRRRWQAGKKLTDCYPVGVAVVVQKMIESEISGICFTVHPVTKDKNQMVIEAGWGLGEAIVGGKITPDTYVINKSQIPNSLASRDLPKGDKSQTNSKFQIQNYKQNAIMDKNISEQKMMIVRADSGIEEVKVSVIKQNKQKLSDKQILELAGICLKIEKHYKFPQDIEWAMGKGKFYIVQSRPITTL